MSLRYTDLDADQRKTLRVIVREGRRVPRKMRDVLTAAAAMTVLVEKNAHHTPGGDRDSGGAYQQRPSQGWGPASETVTRDTRQFYAAAQRAYKPGMSAGDLAAAVQRPAAQYRGRYAQRGEDAASLLRSTPSTGTAPGPRRAGTPLPTTGVAPAPADVDLGPQRLEAVRMFQRGQASPLDFALSMQEIDKQGQAPAAASARARTAPRAVKSARSSGRATITGPNPGRIQPGVLSFMRKLSAELGEPVSGSDGTGHSYRTATGGVSQHSTGNAVDLPARGKKLIAMGQAALIAAGMPRAQARKQQGGLYNVNGHQIIFNDTERVSGSAHDDHLHVSSR